MMQINIKETRSIFISVLILVGIGTIMVYSSTALIAMRKYGDGFHYLWNHLFTVFAGLAAMVILAKTNYKMLRPLVYVMIGLSLVMLILVFLPGIGVSANGARRWVKLWPTTFQPSEFVKIVMVIFLAHYMDHIFPGNYNPAA
jgi:cell division protein FtsW